MKLDMIVTLGNVLQIAASVVAIFMAYTLIRERLVRIETRLETQLEPVWQHWLNGDRRKNPRG